MTKEFYDRIAKPYREHPALLNILKLLNYGIVAITFVSYAILLIWKLYADQETFLRVFLTPGISFFVVEILRRVIPAKRPYEALDISPLIPKNKSMNSFPSRHTYSIYVIAMCFFRCFYPVGIFLSALGVIMAYVRVVGGMHFPRDVLAGAAIGVLSGFVGLYLIP